MKFNYYPERVKPYPIKNLSLDRHLLTPGLNEIPDRYQDNRLITRLIKVGAIEKVLDEKPSKKDDKSANLTSKSKVVNKKSAES